MRVTLKPSEGMEYWFTIVRQEHDGACWIEKTRYGGQIMMSERLVPNACIEGDGGEMRFIAKAIKERGSFEAKRCAVRFEADGVHLWSPRNSTEDGIITIEEADELADHIYSILGEPT